MCTILPSLQISSRTVEASTSLDDHAIDPPLLFLLYLGRRAVGVRSVRLHRPTNQPLARSGGERNERGRSVTWSRQSWQLRHGSSIYFSFLRVCVADILAGRRGRGAEPQGWDLCYFLSISYRCKSHVQVWPRDRSRISIYFLFIF
jgi:hypothetical protein